MSAISIIRNKKQVADRIAEMKEGSAGNKHDQQWQSVTQPEKNAASNDHLVSNRLLWLGLTLTTVWPQERIG